VSIAGAQCLSKCWWSGWLVVPSSGRSSRSWILARRRSAVSMSIAYRQDNTIGPFDSRHGQIHSQLPEPYLCGTVPSVCATPVNCWFSDPALEQVGDRAPAGQQFGRSRDRHPLASRAGEHREADKGDKVLKATPVSPCPSPMSCCVKGWPVCWTGRVSTWWRRPPTPRNCLTWCVIAAHIIALTDVHHRGARCSPCDPSGIARQGHSRAVRACGSRARDRTAGQRARSATCSRAGSSTSPISLTRSNASPKAHRWSTRTRSGDGLGSPARRPSGGA
jgi:hypothetical protein